MTTQYESNLFLYISAGVVILLVILIVVQLSQASAIANETDRYPSRLLVDTRKGLLAVDNYSIADELDRIKSRLAARCVGAKLDLDNDSLAPMINDAIQNLASFIQENPSNSEALCGLELRANLVDQYMQESVNPDPSSYTKSYQSLLDWDDFERELPTNSYERLKFLIKNIDIAIKMLRNNVCDQGKLNLTLLNNILHGLNQQIQTTGSMHVPTSVNDLSLYNRYDRPPPLPLFLKDTQSSEPFESRPTRFREGAHHDGFGSGELLTVNNLGGASADMPLNVVSASNSLTPNGTVAYTNYKFPTGNVVNLNDMRNGGRKQTGNMNIPMTLTNNSTGGISNTIPTHTMLDDIMSIDRNPNINRSLFANTVDGMSNLASTDRIAPTDENGFADYANGIKEIQVGNRTLEGSVERDILGHKPPGHLIAQLYEPSEQWTVLNGSCGGRAISDDCFFSECTSMDLMYQDALNGNPQKMLGCIGDCYKEPNYLKWYAKAASASAVHDSYGMDDYNIPGPIMYLGNTDTLK